MANQLTPNIKFKGFDDNNNPLNGGKVYTYAAGSNTPRDTYQDITAGSVNTNPIILNARGEADIWLADGLAYKIVLHDSNDVEVWSKDNITGAGGGSGGGSTGSLQEAYNGGENVEQATGTPIRLKAGGANEDVLEVYDNGDSFGGNPQGRLTNLGARFQNPSDPNNEYTAYNRSGVYMGHNLNNWINMSVAQDTFPDDFSLELRKSADNSIRLAPSQLRINHDANNDLLLNTFSGGGNINITGDSAAQAFYLTVANGGTNLYMLDSGDSTTLKPTQLILDPSGSNQADLTSTSSQSQLYLAGGSNVAYIRANNTTGSEVYLTDGTDDAATITKDNLGFQNLLTPLKVTNYSNGSIYMSDSTGNKTVSISVDDYSLFMRDDANNYISISANNLFQSGDNGVFASLESGLTPNESRIDAKGSVGTVFLLSDASKAEINMSAGGNAFSDHIVSGNDNTDTRMGNFATGAKIEIKAGDTENSILLTDGTKTVSIDENGFYAKGDSSNPVDGDYRLTYDSGNSRLKVEVYNASGGVWEAGDLEVDDIITSPASVRISDIHRIGSGADVINFKNIYDGNSIVYGRQFIGDHLSPATETVQNYITAKVWGDYLTDTGGASPLGSAVDFMTQFTSPVDFTSIKTEVVVREALTNETITYNAYYGTDTTGNNIVRQVLENVTLSSGDTLEFPFPNLMHIKAGIPTYTEVRKSDGTFLQVAESSLVPSSPYSKVFFRLYEDKRIAFQDETLGDAPTDGNTYGRKDGAWEEVTGGGSDQVKVSSNDTTAGYLEDKIEVDGAIVKSVTNEGGNEKIKLDSYLNVSTGDYLDIDGNFVLNPNQFRVGTILGQRTKITHIGVALYQNNLATGASATLRVALSSIDGTTGISTVIEEGSLAIDHTTPAQSVINVPLDNEAEIGDLGLNYQLSAGYNGLTGGGGSLRLYRIRLSNTNDFRISGQFSLTGAYPSTFTATNENNQPLLIAYHNSDQIDITLPEAPERAFLYDEAQYTQVGTQNFNDTGVFVDWGTFADSRLNLTHEDFTLSSANTVTVNHDGIYNISGNIRYYSDGQRMQATVKVYINDVDLGLFFTDSYIRNSGSSSDYWNNSFGGFDISLNDGDTIKIWIEQERQDVSSITGTIEANQGILRLERKD